MSEKKETVQAATVGAPIKDEVLDGERKQSGVSEPVPKGAGEGYGASADDYEELVDYTAPLLPGAERQTDVFVGVNGETIRIQRGVPVKIKRKFVEVLRNAQEQEMEAYKAMRTAQDAGSKAVAAM